MKIIAYTCMFDSDHKIIFIIPVDFLIFNVLVAFSYFYKKFV
jgi:hypothetical protein